MGKNKEGRSAICLLSGGLDSTVALLLSKNMGYKPIKAINFDYSQIASKKEKIHSKKISDYFNVPFLNINFPFYRYLENRSALLNKSVKLPSPTLNDLRQTKSFRNASAVWVPNRNGCFIEVAALIAENWGINNIIVGFNKEEARTFPDNSEKYLSYINKSLSFSTKNKVKVISPTLKMTKSEIVKILLDFNFPFDLLWSCYGNGKKMCGKCESCMRLKNALLKNGVKTYELFKY